jgi:glycosyl-4,4'-diaponeurosporenoate acyltransferase
VFTNIIVWLCIHLGVSSFVSIVPRSFVASFSLLYKIKNWERNGHVYERLGVKVWKGRLPEARKWFRREKTIAHIREMGNIQMFERQTNRSELSHWLQMLPALLFFLFHPPWAGWIMVAYAILFNVPFIMVQRYNRARLERLKDWQERRS